VARPDDANCCPSDAFDYAVRLHGTRLVLVEAELRAASEPGADAGRQSIGFADLENPAPAGAAVTDSGG
jgi:hypothetical protein